MALHDGGDRQTQILSRVCLYHVALNAYPPGFFHKLPAFVHGENQDGGKRGKKPDSARGVQAVHHRHGDVQNNEVGPGFLRFLDGFLSVGGLIAHFEGEDRGQREAYTLSNTWLIIGY